MQCVLPKTTIRIPMGDLRTRITKVIWKVFQNTPPIDATDDEWESWWNDSTQEEKALSYIQADAVIRELKLSDEVEKGER